MPKRTIRNYQLFFIALGIFCIAAIATNLALRKVPVHDATAESDLSSISGAIDSYVSAQSHLPANLSDVSSLSTATQKRLGDYAYTPSIGYSYQLCVNFLDVGRATTKPYTVANGAPDTSQHAKGLVCFQHTAQTFNKVPPGQPAPQAQ